jgi:hypothetical protein
MLVPFTEKDFLAEARENVTQQFKNKDIFDKYLQLMLSGYEDVQTVFKDIIQQRSIDNAEGVQLDTIGEIVGQPRELITLDLFEYFGFEGAPTSLGFGDLSDPSIGGEFYSSGTPAGGSYVLDDPTYRIFIRSKILKNNTASTPEQLIKFISFIFGGIVVFLEEGDAHIVINFGRELSELEKNLIYYISYSQGYPSRLIPKTLGVGIEFAEFNSGMFFAFDGVPNAMGFGDAFGETGFGEDWGDDWGGDEEPVEDGGYFAFYI